AKSDLAKKIIEEFYSRDAAEKAEREFEKVFAKKETPEEMDELVRKCGKENIWLAKLMVEAGISKSTSESIRLIKQGGVSLDGLKISDENTELKAGKPAEYLLKVGKRRFLKIIFR
ncbi:MAG: S4 domain-containing protein, partial [Acidobacteriota bacterium]